MAELYLPNSDVEVLTPSTSECDCLWRWAFGREVIKLECGHTGGPHSRMTGVLIKRGHLDTDTHARRTSHRPRRKAWTGSPPAPRRSQPCGHLDRPQDRICEVRLVGLPGFAATCSLLATEPTRAC